MITIGLTGKYCSGKSFIASLFTQRNIAVIDVDQLGHSALLAVRDQVLDTFGNSILASDGTVDRKALGRIVFADPVKLTMLETLVHPVMVENCKEIIEGYRIQGRKAVVINAALLHRMQLDALCDFACFVYTPTLIRYVRAVRRDKVTISSFLRIARAQKDISPTRLLGPSSVYILENWRGVAFIHRQMDEFCATIGI